MKKQPASDSYSRKSQPVDLRGAKTQQPGIYDALLFVSMGFLLTGIVFLFLELYRYEFTITP